jgi:hypothetical protein
MSQADAIDLSFLENALSGIKDSLSKARAAQSSGNTSKWRESLLEAGGVAVAALQELHDHPLWDKLREEQARRLEEWDEFTLPLIEELFIALGYRPPPSAQVLIDLNNKGLRLAAGLPDPNAPDPISTARIAIDRLRSMLSRLIWVRRHWYAIENGILVAFKTLGKALGAALTLKAAEKGLQEISDYAPALLGQLHDRAPHVLPSLSIALTTNISESITSWLSGPDTPALNDAIHNPPSSSRQGAVTQAPTQSPGQRPSTKSPGDRSSHVPGGPVSDRWLMPPTAPPPKDTGPARPPSRRPASPAENPFGPLDPS